MFGKKRYTNALEPPPMADADPTAVEILRVWTAPDGPQQLTLQPAWDDPGAWGLLLVDISRQVIYAYERQGRDAAEVAARIRELFDAEWSSPTDAAADLTDES